MPTAIITGDIISSRRMPEKSLWLNRLKSILGKKTDLIHPSRWNIYRGDSFQLEVKSPENALRVALLIRSGLKAIPEFHKLRLDVRMAIGIGKPGFRGKTVNES